MDFSKIIPLLLLVIFTAFSAAGVGREMHEIFSTSSPNPYINIDDLIGFPLMYILALTSIFTAVGPRHKYIWIGILIIPVAGLEVYLSPVQIYLPAVVAVAGWLIGWLMAKIMRYT